MSRSSGASAYDDVGAQHAEIRMIWMQVLGQIDVSLDSDFFEVGGSSLEAMRISAIVSKRLGVKVSISVLLAAPVFKDYCAQVDTLLASSDENE